MGIENTFVLFPPMDRPELYSKLGNDFTGKAGKNIRPLQFWQKPYYGEPVCLAFDNRMLVASDAIMDEGFPHLIIQFISGSSEAQLLRSISKEKFNQKTKTPSALKTHIDTTHIKRERISIKK